MRNAVTKNGHCGSACPLCNDLLDDALPELERPEIDVRHRQAVDQPGAEEPHGGLASSDMAITAMANLWPSSLNAPTEAPRWR